MTNLIDIIQFIRAEINEPEMEINELTRIEDDLGVTGDEAIELIENFSKKFNVDIAEFQFSKYFYPEPSPYYSFKKEIVPLTVGDLERAASMGKLI